MSNETQKKALKEKNLDIYNRDLDAAVGKEVFGYDIEYGDTWTWFDWGASNIPTEKDGPGIVNPDFSPRGMNPPLRYLPRYSLHIADAWKVIRKIEELDEGGRYYWTLQRPVCGTWTARVHDELKYDMLKDGWNVEDKENWIYRAPYEIIDLKEPEIDFCHAVCRTALLVVRNRDD
jgi:hypothetical protein